MHGIGNDVSINNLTSSGYSIFYEAMYSDVTSSNDLTTLKSNCKNKYSSLCIAGGDSVTQNLITVGCAYCFSVLADKTVLNKPTLNVDASAYWFYTDLLSFGFSPTSTINQVSGSGDMFNLTDNTRLSWNIDGSSGGYRLGVLYGNFTDGYKKFAFVKEMLLFDCPSSWSILKDFNCTLTQKYKTSLKVTVNFGNNVVQTVSVINEVTMFKNKYTAYGVFTVSMTEANLKMSLSTNVSIQLITTTTSKIFFHVFTN